MKKKLLLQIIAIIGVIWLLSMGWYFMDDLKGIPYAPNAKTMQWNTYISESKLNIRRVKSNQPNFLFKPSAGEGAFEFDASTSSFKPVSQSIWESAEGPIKSCDSEMQSPIKHQDQSYGDYTLYKLNDWKGGKWAVLSASGPKLPSFLRVPIIGGEPRILGTRYFEIRNGQNWSSVVRIKELDHSIPLMCWTPDEDFVVIYESYFVNFSVVDVGSL